MKHFTFIAALLFCATFSTPLVAGGDEAANLRMRKKLKTIIIPKIQFADTSIRTVLEFLKNKSRAIDPDSEGINFMLILKPQKRAVTVKGKKAAFTEVVPEPKVTMDMNNLPLGDAIRFLCTQTGLAYVVEPHAVVIMDKTVTRQRLELRIFNIDPRVLKDVKDVKKFFKDKGVKFPVSNR
jgi:hypothetical protein